MLFIDVINSVRNDIDWMRNCVILPFSNIQYACMRKFDIYSVSCKFCAHIFQINNIILNYFKKKFPLNVKINVCFNIPRYIPVNFMYRAEFQPSGQKVQYKYRQYEAKRDCAPNERSPSSDIYLIQISIKDFSLCHQLWLLNSFIYVTQCRKP